MDWVYHILLLLSHEIDHAGKAPSSHHQRGLARSAGTDELLVSFSIMHITTMYQDRLSSDAFGGLNSTMEGLG